MGFDQCTITIRGSSIHFVNILYPDAGSFILGGIRILIFSLFAWLNYRNHRLVAAKEGSFNMAYVRGLILPSYHEFFYILIGVNIIAAIFDIVTAFLPSSTAVSINNIILPIEMGVFHCLSEGFAVFLMKHGAGIIAFRHSLFVGGIWGLFSFMVFFLEIRFRNGDNEASKLSFLLFFIYFTCLLMFYGSLSLAPMSVLYRRGSLKFYATFSFCYVIFLLVSASLVAGDQDWAICPTTLLGLIFLAIFQPYVIYRTLQMDSQYWQGRSINPLSDIWDEIDLSTAASMAAGLYDMERQSGHLPILHFGLISLDSSLGYVAGGYSRVYFGKFQRQKVALKIMYVMELTPSDVNDYYREAAILHSLQHPNVVGCHGICVMPPALTLVLEFCLFGSLFDFIHKRRLVNVTADDMNGSSRSISTVSMIGRSILFPSFGEPSAADARELAIRKICNEQSIHPVDAGLFRETEIGEVGVKKAWSTSFGISSKAMLNENNMIRPKTALTASLLHDDQRDSMSDGSGHNVTNILSSQLETQSVGSNRSLRIGGIATTYSNPYPLDSRDVSRHVSIEGAGRERAPSILERMRDSILSVSGLRSSFVASAPVQQKELLPFAHYLSLVSRIRMCLDCCRAVAHLHAKGFMHCDIKSLNFLVCEDMTVKLADFGETVTINSPPRHKGAVIQARQWAPPEVLAPNAEASVYSIESDIYSLSIVLSEILSLTLFGEEADKMLQDAWYNILVNENLRPKLTQDCPPILASAVKVAWNSDKSFRNTSAELLEAVEKVYAQMSSK